jgi:hypothetical protein
MFVSRFVTPSKTKTNRTNDRAEARSSPDAEKSPSMKCLRRSTSPLAKDHRSARAEREIGVLFERADGVFPVLFQEVKEVTKMFQEDARK